MSTSFKKNLFFVFIFWLPVNILVYYLQQVVLTLVEHFPLINYINHFAVGDILIISGIFIVFFSLSHIDSFLMNRFNITNQFVIAGIDAVLLGALLTIGEFIIGLLMLYTLGFVGWDYTSYVFNYKGIICPLVAFIWCIASFIFRLVIYKYFLWLKSYCDNTLYTNMTHNYQLKKIIILCFCYWVIFISDLFYSFYKMYYFSKDSQNKGLNYICYPEIRPLVKMREDIILQKSPRRLINNKDSY